MAEKKIQENPLPETVEATEMPEKQKEMPSKSALVKTIPAQPPATSPSPWISMPAFTKMEPNDLYRRLLPAVLFVLTFVTVMTMLLIYMDTVALGAQQFRLNMSRDYELARISQSSPPLVAYVRQLHLAPRPPTGPQPPPVSTPSVAVLDTHGEMYNGTFIDFLPSGPRSPTTLYLERARRWDGVVVRAAARDYLPLRASVRAAHACLSPTDHPREVSYQEAESGAGAGAGGAPFASRVLCLPLYTVLLAAGATRPDYVLLGGDAALPALTHVPYGEVTIKMIEVLSTDLGYRNRTSAFLATKNYTMAATFPDSVMYVLNRDVSN